MAFLVVTYDVPCNKRRTRLHKQLKNYGEPVQYSVFEFDLTARQKNSLLKVIKDHIQKDEDRVRIYEFCGGCSSRVVVLGVGQEPQRNMETMFV